MVLGLMPLSFPEYIVQQFGESKWEETVAAAGFDTARKLELGDGECISRQVLAVRAAAAAAAAAAAGRPAGYLNLHSWLHACSQGC